MRTNSLAFASVDCHTCMLRRARCDRKRPKCSTCLSTGVKCAGFATPLSWDQRRMWVIDGKHRTASTFTASGATSSKATRKFQFVGQSTRRGTRALRQQARFTVAAAPVTLPSDVPPVTTTGNAITPPLYQSHGSPRPIIEDVPATNCGEAFEQALFEVPQAQILSRSQDMLPASAANAGEEAPVEDLPPLDFDHILLDSPFSQITEATSSGNYQNVSVNYDEFLEMNEANFEDHCTADRESNTGDIDQQNVWSTVLDFPKTLPASTLPNLPRAHTGLLSWPLSATNHEALLLAYDQELCVLPLTSDTVINPFRCGSDILRGSRLLFHSVLALCYQHLQHQTKKWSNEVEQHKAQATNELAVALTNPAVNTPNVNLLDSILIMFTLDCTLSAAGSWTTHLRRARTVIDLCGGPSALNNDRSRSQAGMLLWWDASLALISRKKLVFDASYVEYLLEKEKNDLWSFYDLTGCPAEMIKWMIVLSELASEFEIASTMKWVTFDLNPVLAIESQLNAWTSNVRPKSSARQYTSAPSHDSGIARDAGASSSLPEMATATNGEEENEEEVNLADDQRHCVEAWRQALLIYIRRVFKIGQTSPAAIAGIQNDKVSREGSQRLPWGEQLWRGPQNASGRHDRHSKDCSHQAPEIGRVPFFTLVRYTINEIRCVRPSSQIQKQLLLPAFIAGSETSDPESRRFLCAYCDWWSNRSRYKMFDTVHKLLRQVWDEMDRETSKVAANKVQQTSSSSFVYAQPGQSANNSQNRPKEKSASCWWGSVVDRNVQRSSSDGSPVEYLLG